MKRFALLLACLMILSLPALALAASDITNAGYKTTITVSNSAATTADSYVPFTLSTPAMIASGMLNANATDAVMRAASGADVAFMPGYDATTPWVMHVPSVPANSSTFQYLYTNGTSGGALAYFPGNTGMTTPDHATLELAANFYISQTCRLDFSAAGVGGSLVKKQDAISAVVSGPGSLSVGIHAPVGTVTAYPNGPGAVTLLGQYPTSGAHWDKVDDPAGAPDDSATYVSENQPAEWKAAIFAVDTSAVPVGAAIISVDVYYRVITPLNGSWYATTRPILYLNGVRTNGTNAGGTSWTTGHQVLARPGGGSWTYTDMASLQVGIDIGPAFGSGGASCTQLYAVVTYGPGFTVSGISDADHVYRLAANGTTLKLYIDNVESGSVALGGTSVPDNANPWIFCESAAVPYLYSQTIMVGGWIKQSITWQHWPTTSANVTNGTGIATGSPITLAYGSNTITVTQVGTFTVYLPTGINGTATSGSTTVSGSPQTLVEGSNTVTTTTATGTFTINLFPIFRDQSGNSMNATPSFRTTSSNANLTGIVSSQESLLTSGRPSASGGTSSWQMIDPASIVEPPSLFTEGGSSFPLGEEIKALGPESGNDDNTFLIITAFGLSILAGLGVFAFTQKSKLGVKGSLFLQCLVSLMVLVLFVEGYHTIPAWIYVPYGLEAIVVMLWRNPYQNPVS